jgi:hypothetical protein
MRSSDPCSSFPQSYPLAFPNSLHMTLHLPSYLPTDILLCSFFSQVRLTGLLKKKKYCMLNFIPSLHLWALISVPPPSSKNTSRSRRLVKFSLERLYSSHLSWVIQTRHGFRSQLWRIISVWGSLFFFSWQNALTQWEAHNIWNPRYYLPNPWAICEKWCQG